jgi:vacuolar-type H+-ATPase subunit E/Vma4
MIESCPPESSAQARQLRKFKLRKRKFDECDISIDSPEKSIEVLSQIDDTDDGTKGLKKIPHKTGIKRNARYDPGVAMTREELVEWRKEARRVRNRESAAESRQRTRSRIEALEAKLELLESKYAAALERISDLETINKELSLKEIVSTVAQPADVVPPEEGTSDYQTSVGYDLQSISTHSTRNISSPHSAVSSDGNREIMDDLSSSHIMDMISRPTA